MIANFSHTKKESILNSIDFGAVVSVTSNRPMGGGGIYTKSITPQQQFDMVKYDIGGNCVRIAVTTTIDGSANKPGYGNYENRLITSLQLCQSMGIKVILLLDDRLPSYMNKTEVGGLFEWEDITRDIAWTENELNVDDGRSADNGGVVMGVLQRCETQHYQMVQGFINLYGQYMDLSTVILELSNEPELFRKIWKSSGNGTSINHFWPQKTELARVGFKGMYEAARATEPTLKVSTPANSGWCPVAFYDIIIGEMPDVDYISYHWYSDQEFNMDRGQWPSSAGGTAGADFRNIFDWLRLKWGKQVIITESNGRNSSNQAGFLQQDYQIGHFSSFIPKAVEADNCERITAYALMSDPYRTGEESTFGLYWFPNIDTGADPSNVDFQGTITPKKAVAYLKYLTT